MTVLVVSTPPVDVALAAALRVVLKAKTCPWVLRKPAVAWLAARPV